jgi:hypothetical protein
MSETSITQFKNELDSFFGLVILNLVFGALAIAFCVQFILASILGLTAGRAMPELLLLTGAISLVCFGLGLSWILSGAKILKGITGIRREFRNRQDPVSDEALTCWIIRTMAHYRDNQKTIHTMILVCTLGGFCFLGLGLLNSLEFFSINLSSGTFTLNSYILLPSALLALAVAIVSLASSFWFAKFSKTWDLRQDEITRAEHVLAKKLGLK